MWNCYVRPALCEACKNDALRHRSKVWRNPQGTLTARHSRVYLSISTSSRPVHREFGHLRNRSPLHDWHARAATVRMTHRSATTSPAASFFAEPYRLVSVRFQELASLILNTEILGYVI